MTKPLVNIEITPGEVLKTLREVQGLGQQDLSNLTSIDQSNISAIESGTRQLGRERVLANELKYNEYSAI